MTRTAADICRERGWGPGTMITDGQPDTPVTIKAVHDEVVVVTKPSGREVAFRSLMSDWREHDPDAELVEAMCEAWVRDDWDRHYGEEYRQRMREVHALLVDRGECFHPDRAVHASAAEDERPLDWSDHPDHQGERRMCNDGDCPEWEIPHPDHGEPAPVRDWIFEEQDGAPWGLRYRPAGSNDRTWIYVPHPHPLIDVLAQLHQERQERDPDHQGDQQPTRFLSWTYRCGHEVVYLSYEDHAENGQRCPVCDPDHQGDDWEPTAGEVARALATFSPTDVRIVLDARERLIDQHRETEQP